MKPFGYCAQTLANPNFPKSCANSENRPVGGRFKCVDDKGFPLPPTDCNPLWQMIGNDWSSQGVNLPYLANFLKIFALLFASGARPPMEPDYFDVRSAYKGAVLEPYPFLTPGTTPNNLAPPL